MAAAKWTNQELGIGNGEAKRAFQIQNSEFQIHLDGVQMDPVTACLLHNESASYCQWRQPKVPWTGGEAKASTKCAFSRWQ